MTVYLQFALARYQAALACLDGPKLRPEQALEILSARDALQRALSAESQVPVDILWQVVQLDSQLKKRDAKLTKVLDLAECRASLPNPPQDWWWNLNRAGFDWLFKGLRVIAWTASLGLLADMVTRFLSGGVGVIGASAVTLPSILALLKARSELTEAGKEGWEKLLTRLKIRLHWREGAKFGSTLLLSGLMLGFWGTLPWFSQRYNQWGLENYESGRLGTAEQDFLRAITLNRDNLDAHYNLGNLYEDLQEFDSARKQYQLAAKGDIPDAYSNLGRLYIRDKNYPQAIALLERGLQLAEEQNSFPEVRYSLFKNLGWARFEQGRDDLALPVLQAAIGTTASYPEAAKYFRNPGSAHWGASQIC